MKILTAQKFLPGETVGNPDDATRVNNNIAIANGSPLVEWRQCERVLVDLPAFKESDDVDLRRLHFPYKVCFFKLEQHTAIVWNSAKKKTPDWTIVVIACMKVSNPVNLSDLIVLFKGILSLHNIDPRDFLLSCPDFGAVVFLYSR